MIVIGITGVAQSGKDTLYKCLDSILIKRGLNVAERFALADDLKADLNDFTIKHLGISAFTRDLKEKGIIRDLMVSYGHCQRLKTHGKYWTSKLNEKIKDCLFAKNLPIITDIRYDEYPEDERYWLQEFWRGRLVHITRFDKGIELRPPNEKEALNIPRLKEKSVHFLTWSTCSDFDFLISTVENQLADLIEEIVESYRL